MSTAVLYPGDSVHLVLPSTGNQAKDDQIIEQIRAVYRNLGVNLAIGTAPTGNPEMRVVAIFRKPTLIPVEEK
jgi:hypothetical protein